MKHQLTLHYSIRNGGDGSAYPTFMSSEKLAEWDQEHQDEGWGEICIGSITVESDSPISVKEEIETPESYFINLIDDDDQIEEFVAEFFPDGKPRFTVETEPATKDYLCNNVFVNGVKVAKVFRLIARSGPAFEQLLND